MGEASSDSSFYDRHIDTINPDAIWNIVSSVSGFDVNVDWLDSFDSLLHKFLQKDSRVGSADGRKMLDLLELVEKNLLGNSSKDFKKQLMNLRKLVNYRVQETGKITDETRKINRRENQSSKPLEQQEIWHGPYRRLKKLGSGSMGVVYLGEEPNSKQQVALKLLHTRNLNNIEDIENEARAAMKISHENCVKVMGIIHDRIYDPMYGEYRKVPIVVAEYVEGQSLGDLLEHKMFQDLKPKVAFSRLAALLISEQIARGLVACHHVGVIHRDIKPDNCIVLQPVIDRLVEAYRKNWGLNMETIELIMVEERQKGIPWIKISDLGSALIAEEPKGDDFTFSVKKFIPGGSPAYMAPESVRDEVSGRTDIFALGMTLYQLLTGRNPREARQVAEGINALKYQSSYVYLEDLRKAKATHAVDIDTDPAFDHFKNAEGNYGDNLEILELLRQMTVRDRRSRIRTTSCQAALRTMVDSELKTLRIEELLAKLDEQEASNKQIEDENKGVKKYYAVQLKNYQSKIKMVQALEENLENELAKRDKELKELQSQSRESVDEVKRSNRYVNALTEKKERLEATNRLVRKELERVERKLSDRERCLAKADEDILELHQALNSLSAKNSEVQKILKEKQGHAHKMSEKIEQFQEMANELSNLNYFMQISEALSLFPNLEDSVSMSVNRPTQMDPSSTTFKRSTEDQIVNLFQNLRGDTLYLSELNFDEDQIVLLKGHPGLSRLKHIVFEGRPIGDFLQILVNSPHLENLEILEIRECKISVKAMKKLINSANLNSLKALYLEEAELATDAIKFFARSTSFTQLETLSLARNALGSDGLKMLSKAHCCETLKHLNLESNGLQQDDLEILVGAKHLNQLQSLNLNDNQIGPDGCQVLASSKSLQTLRELNLDGNQIGPIGLQYVIDSEHLIGLNTLHLEHNELGIKGAKALANATAFTNLTQLTLGANALTDEGITALAKTPFLKNMKLLDLGGNSISGAGAQALASCEALGQLESLNLNLNSIQAEGVKALASSNSIQKLEVLNLYLNQIGDEGLTALIASESFKTLKKLDVGANSITDVGAKLLLDWEPLEQLEDLVLFSNTVSVELHAKIEEKNRGQQPTTVLETPQILKT
jgi:serine/threonine protein kinase